MLTRPDAKEHAEFYNKYISLVPDGSLLDFLSRQLGDYRELFSGVSDDAASAPPQSGKWSAKEVLGHVCDTERILSYRALRFARGDGQELRGFEQDDYVREAYSNSRPLTDLIFELESIRRASIALLGSLPEEAAGRTGVANQNPVSVRALAYIIGGHAEHHLQALRARSRELTTKA